MKIHYIILSIAAALAFAACSDDDSATGTPALPQTTQDGAKIVTLQGYENASSGFSSLVPDETGAAIYIENRQLTGNGYAFAPAGATTLAAMTAAPSAGWGATAEIAAGSACWVRYANGNETVIYKVRIIAINGNDVTAEYIFSGISTADAGQVSTKGRWASRIEVPELESGNLFRSYVTKEGNDSIMAYALEWDPDRRHSRWVAFAFFGRTAERNWSRSDWSSTEWGGDPFQEDPTLPADSRTTLSDYRGSGYDRGHLCASADRLYSKNANLYTFYLSNMSPQKSSFNQGIWAGLETLVQTWGRTPALRDTLYVCKGGTIGNEADIETYVNNMPVPKYYFMALISLKNSTYKGIAFLLEHRMDYTEPYDFAAHALSIDELEERTGIDFFCNLPDAVENEVEASFDTSEWMW